MVWRGGPNGRFRGVDGADVSSKWVAIFMASLTAVRAGTRGSVVSPYNGKLDKPHLYSRALGQTGLLRLADDDTCEEFDECLGAAWELGHDLASNRVADTGPYALHGDTVNMPTNGMDSLRRPISTNWLPC